MGSTPSWWPDGQVEPPSDWLDSVRRLTSTDGDRPPGLEAAMFISRTRKLTGEGPTFSELFAHMLRRAGAALSDSVTSPVVV